MTQAAITQKARPALQRTIEALGGVANLNEHNMPFVRDEAPPGQDLETSEAAPPNAYVVTVASDVSFGELHALVRAIDEGGRTATLRGCAGPAGTQGDVIPGC